MGTAICVVCESPVAAEEATEQVMVPTMETSSREVEPDEPPPTFAKYPAIWRGLSQERRDELRAKWGYLKW